MCIENCNFVIVFFRYYKLQIYEYQKYKVLGEKNSISARILNAPRGIIFDRNNIPIVDNNPLYQMKIISKDMQENFNYQIANNNPEIYKRIMIIKTI